SNDGDEEQTTIDEETAEDEEEDLSRFDQVFECIDFGKVAAYATSVRRSQKDADPTGSHDMADPLELEIDCDIMGPPLYGSFHILFPLAFKDGKKWILKVPAAGYRGKWDSLAANSLRSEALVMRKLASETTIPLPTVYSFDTSLENQLKCPFILMEYMEGSPLYNGWFNEASDSLETFRAHALESLASAMVQLRAYTFSKGGTPCFDDDGNVTEITTSRIFDSSTSYNRLAQPECDEGDPFCNIGPFNDERDRLLYLLNRHRPGSTMRQGFYEMLRLFIKWLPEDRVTGYARFVLAHPDFALQNVLVAEDGSLQGILDWDGVCASSIMQGCESYPVWLTRDWTAQMYNYDTKTGQAKTEYYPRENSPQELAYYRNMYSQFMEKLLAEKEPDNGQPRMYRPAFTAASSLTRKSLITASLDVAVNDPMCTLGVASHLFDEIRHLTAPKWEKLIREEEEEWKEYLGVDDASSESNAPEMEDVAPSEQPVEEEQPSSAPFLNASVAAGPEYGDSIDGTPVPVATEAHLKHLKEQVYVCDGTRTTASHASYDPPTSSAPTDLVESAGDQKCNEGNNDFSAQVNDDTASPSSAHVPSLHTDLCTHECKALYCVTHHNLKVPSRVLQLSHGLRSIVDRLPSQGAQNKRRWLKVPSMVCNASDHLRSLAHHLPEKEAGDRACFNLPHVLSAISDRLKTTSTKFHHSQEKVLPVQEPQPPTVNKLAPNLWPSWAVCSRNSINGPSLLLSISGQLYKAAERLHAQEMSTDVSKGVSLHESHGAEKDVSWVDVAQEMEKHGIAPADIYKHCDSIAALVEEIGLAEKGMRPPERALESAGADISLTAELASPSTDHDTNNSASAVCEHEEQQQHAHEPSVAVDSEKVMHSKEAIENNKPAPFAAAKAAKEESTTTANVQQGKMELPGDGALTKENEQDQKEEASPNNNKGSTEDTEDDDDDEEYISYKTLDYDFNAGEVALGLMNGTLHPLNRHRLQEGFYKLWAIT
ncbi:MAG: hypothetical protein Q9191_008075, partial [Dirinaria sp. TL-2023a]